MGDADKVTRENAAEAVVAHEDAQGIAAEDGVACEDTRGGAAVDASDRDGDVACASASFCDVFVLSGRRPVVGIGSPAACRPAAAMCCCIRCWQKCVLHRKVSIWLCSGASFRNMCSLLTCMMWRTPGWALKNSGYMFSMKSRTVRFVERAGIERSCRCEGIDAYEGGEWEGEG